MTTRLFSYRNIFGTETIVEFEDQIVIPADQPIYWTFARLVDSHKIPKFAEDDVLINLKKFIFLETKAYYDNNVSKMYDSISSGLIDVEYVASEVPILYHKHTSREFQVRQLSDEEIFGLAFTDVLQSSAATDLIQLENSFAAAVENQISERNSAIEAFKNFLAKKTEAILQRGGENADKLVSLLQRTSHSEFDNLKVDWDSRISELKDSHRRDYRQFVMSMAEQLREKLATPSRSLARPRTSLSTPAHCQNPTSNKLNAQSEQNSLKTMPTQEVKPVIPETTFAPRSESFTVQLGRQLRISYYFKLVHADPIYLMTNVGSFFSSGETDTSVCLAERLSSAMTIYSNQLTGLINLVDSKILQSANRSPFAKICERSTDYHFPNFECQLAEMQKTLEDLNCLRDAESDHLSATISQDAEPIAVSPSPGDVLITRHANLASRIGGVAGGGGGISIIFHVVLDDAEEAKQADRLHNLSTIHSSLSAILRVCFRYHISTLFVPLLLSRIINEHTKLAWCIRRAETVLKAVKSSLLELSTHKEQILRTIVLLIPPELPPAYFNAFQDLVISCFQLSNPLIPTHT